MRHTPERHTAAADRAVNPICPSGPDGGQSNGKKMNGRNWSEAFTNRDDFRRLYMRRTIFCMIHGIVKLPMTRSNGWGFIRQSVQIMSGQLTGNHYLCATACS